MPAASIAIGLRGHFVYHQSMDVELLEASIAGIAASIGEPARARMLYCLLDGHARTSTELGVVAGVSPSTASVHLARLKEYRLVDVLAQGKHRYYKLKDRDVARALEALGVVAGAGKHKFLPTTPSRLRIARTCYDHMAGEMAVCLHDRLHELSWLRTGAAAGNDYDVSAKGIQGLKELGIDIDTLRSSRRRFAYGCLDWSERKPHVAGALGSELLKLALRKRWVTQDALGRGLSVTAAGRHSMSALG
jgi:DNA-binding transcriptional ArsR family regulator